MSEPPVIPAKQEQRLWLWAHRLIGAFSLAWLIAIHCIVIIQTLPFYEVPKDTLIRPMAQGLSVLVWSIAAVGIAPVAIVALYFRRRSLWPWVALVLAFTPLPTEWAIFHDAQTKQGFVLAE